MSLSNEIYKKIDVEADACVEAEYSFWKFKPRHKLRPICYKKAYEKYASQLNEAQQTNYTLEYQLNKQTIEALNNNISNSPMYSVAILIVSIIIIYLLFF